MTSGRPRWDVMVEKSSTKTEERYGSFPTEAEATRIANFLGSFGARTRVVPTLPAGREGAS